MIIPGAREGYTAVKTVLAGWEKQGSENERYRWWPVALAEDGAEPLRVSEERSIVIETSAPHLHLYVNSLRSNSFSQDFQSKTGGCIARSTCGIAAVCSKVLPTDIPRALTL